MLPASSDWRIALVLVGISDWVALRRLLLPLSARSLIGGFLLIFQYLLALALMGGRLKSLAPLFPSLCGLLVGLTLLIGPPFRHLVLFRMPGMCMGQEQWVYPV